MPWLGGDSDRHVNYAITSSFWGKHFPIFQSGGKTIGEARNAAAIRAIQQGYQFLFFVDTDIIHKPENVISATKIAETTKSGVYTYGLLTRLYNWETPEFLRNYWVKPHPGAAEAGALVMTADTFIAVCGYPLLSWGEDALLHNALTSFRGPLVRIWDDAFHLPHQSSRGNFDIRLNQVIKASEEAIPTPSKMKLLMQRSRYYDIDTFKSLGYEEE